MMDSAVLNGVSKTAFIEADPALFTKTSIDFPASLIELITRWTAGSSVISTKYS